MNGSAGFVFWGRQLSRASGPTWDEDGEVVDVAEVTVDRSGADRTVSVRVGDVIVVQLEENLTTGYAWEPASLPPWCSVQASEHEQPTDGRMGAAGTRRLRLAVTEPGSGTVEFRLRRPWEPPDKAVDRFGFSVRSD